MRTELPDLSAADKAKIIQYYIASTKPGPLASNRQGLKRLAWLLPTAMGGLGAIGATFM